MPIIVESNPANAALFTSVAGTGSLLVSTLDELKHRLVDHAEEHAIVLGPGVDLDAAAALSGMLRVTRPSLSIILIRRRVDTVVLAEALRSGMREVVEERDLTGLAAAVTRARQTWTVLNGGAAAAPTGRLVTVFSPKGGVGKTTLAVNLAIALSQRDRRVCVVDLDLSFGDIAITLQLLPSRTLADTVPLQGSLDAAALKPLLTTHPTGISALVAPVQPDARDTIPAPLIGRVLTLLKGEFDFVVVDTAPSFDEFVLQALDETDTLLMVTTLDIPTLKNVKIAIETLDLLNFPGSRRRLVLNRADDVVGLSADQVAHALAMPIDAVIPTSAQVAHATNAGEPIVAALPQHAVSLAIGTLAASLGSASSLPAGVPAPPPTGRRRFRRRSGRPA